MDTDSFLFELRNHDFYEAITEYKHLFDTSNYPKNHPAYSEINKKRPGVFTDEYDAEPIRLYVGLRAKSYLVVAKNSVKKRPKGVKRKTLANSISPQDYLDALFLNKEFSHEQSSIVSKKHALYSTRMKKKSLSSYDDKRYIMRDGGIHYRGDITDSNNIENFWTMRMRSWLWGLMNDEYKK